MGLCVEELCRRDNPSLVVAGGVLTAVGGASADSLYFGHDYQTGNDFCYLVGGGAVARVDFAPGSVTAVNADLGGGNDLYVGPSWATAYAENVHGGAGNDFLLGGFQAAGSAGGLYGDAGDDYLSGGVHFASAKTLDGGAGSDLVVCGWGADQLYADPNDTVVNFDASEDSFVVV